MLLEFQERMIIVEEGWSFTQKGNCLCVTHISSREVCINTQDWKGARRSGGRLVQGKDEVRRILKEYFEDLYYIDTQEEVTVHMCGFDGIGRGNYFGGDSMGRAEVEVKMGKLENGKAAGKD